MMRVASLLCALATSARIGTTCKMRPRIFLCRVTSVGLSRGESSLKASVKLVDIGVNAATKKLVPKQSKVSLSMIEGMRMVFDPSVLDCVCMPRM